MYLKSATPLSGAVFQHSKGLKYVIGKNPFSLWYNNYKSLTKRILAANAIFLRREKKEKKWIFSKNPDAMWDRVCVMCDPS